MATKQKNSSWQDKKEVKKGNVGEAYVRQMIERKGYVIYETTTNKPHLIDFFCHKAEKKIIGVEVKAKRRRAYYADTGIDNRVYREYVFLLESNNIDVFLVFVDDFEKLIYGQWISKLKAVAKQHKWQTYFHLSTMKPLRKLLQHEVMELQKYSSITKNYSAVIPFFA